MIDEADSLLRLRNDRSPEQVNILKAITVFENTISRKLAETRSLYMLNSIDSMLIWYLRHLLYRHHHETDRTITPGLRNLLILDEGPSLKTSEIRRYYIYWSHTVACLLHVGIYAVVATKVLDSISQNILFKLRFCCFAFYLFFSRKRGTPQNGQKRGPAAYVASAIWLIRP